MNPPYKIESFMCQGDRWIVTVRLSPDATWVEMWTEEAVEKYLNELAQQGKLEVEDVHNMPGYL